MQDTEKRAWKIRYFVPARVVVLVVVLFLLLLGLAMELDSVQDRLTVQAALDWLQQLAGIMVLLWSGNKVATAFTAGTESRILGTTPAIAGALAGGMLLGLGSWAAPAGLGLIGVMEGVVRWKTGGLLVQQSPPNEDPSNP